MKLKQFAQVIELTKTGSFSQAARNLYISQPNLSYSIKQLEDEIGYPLFTRTNDGVIPTVRARDLIEHMMIIYREYCILQELSQDPTKQHKISLRVATMNLYRTIPYFSSIIKRYMKIPINFSFMNYTSLDSIIDQVITCQVDFALIGILSPYVKSVKTKLKNSRIEYHGFTTSPICALIGPRNPLYHIEEPIGVKDIFPFTLITYGNGNEDPSFSLAHATGLDNDMFGRVHVNSSHLFHQTIESTTAVGLVACRKEAFTKDNLWKELRILQLKDCTINAEIGWIKLQRLPLTDIAAELLDTVKILF